MIDFGMHFLCNMARFLAPKINEKPKNTDSKRHHKIDQFWDRFFIDFCCVLEAKLDPCWPPFSAQEASKTVSRRLQDDPKSAPRSNTTWARDQNRGTPSAQVGYPIGPGGILVDFWSIFGRCWLIFGRCLGLFFDVETLVFC